VPEPDRKDIPSHPIVSLIPPKQTAPDPPVKPGAMTPVFSFSLPAGGVAFIHSPAGTGDTVTRWMIETGNPNALIRAGWRKDSLKQGDEVIVEGYRAKDDTNTVNGSSVHLPDGHKLLAGSSKDGGAVK
jgi:Family of unknown function (DUF6152)